MGTQLLPSTLYAKVQGQHQWKNFRSLRRRRLNYLWFGHEIHPLTLLACTNTYQMTPLHPLLWGCRVYDVINSTMFWVPILGRGISPLEIVRLDKVSSLLALAQIVDEDKVVARSIWSPSKGINVPQRYTKKMNGGTSPVYDVVDLITYDLDIEHIQSPIVHALIRIKWLL
jgi:hypothetical protein